MKIIVTIPVSKNHTVPEMVLDSIRDQSIPTEIHIVENPNILKDQRDHFLRSKVIAESRNRCLVILRNHDFSVMHDASIEHRNKDNFKDMIDFLKGNPDVYAVNLAKRSVQTIYGPHMCNGCIMARRVIWENVEFSPHEKYFCTCDSFSDTVKKYGEHRFLDMDYGRIEKHRKESYIKS